MNKNQKSDQIYNQKLIRSYKKMRDMEESKCLIFLQQFLECIEHEKILKGETLLTSFISPIHECFFQLEKPNVKYLKIKKDLHVVYCFIATLNKDLDNYDEAIKFYKLEHLLTKVEVKPLLKIARIYLNQEKLFEMQKYLMLAKPLLFSPDQILEYYEIWADYFIRQDELEKGWAYIKMVEIYTSMLDLDFYRIYEKYKDVYLNVGKNLKKLETTEDALIECKSLNILFLMNENWLKAYRLWEKLDSNQEP